MTSSLDFFLSNVEPSLTPFVCKSGVSLGERSFGFPFVFVSPLEVPLLTEPIDGEIAREGVDAEASADLLRGRKDIDEEEEEVVVITVIEAVVAGRVVVVDGVVGVEDEEEDGEFVSEGEEERSSSDFSCLLLSFASNISFASELAETNDSDLGEIAGGGFCCIDNSIFSLARMIKRAHSDFCSMEEARKT